MALLTTFLQGLGQNNCAITPRRPLVMIDLCEITGIKRERILKIWAIFHQAPTGKKDTSCLRLNAKAWNTMW